MKTKQKFLVGRLEDLPKQMGYECLIANEKIAIFRLSDDRVKAIRNVCPHKNGPLAEGTVSGDFVFCPLHDYKISLQDGRVEEPDEGCVETYEVDILDGLVYVRV